MQTKQDEIDRIRSDHKEECRNEFYKAAAKGTFIFGTVSLIANVVLHNFWPVWRNRVGISGKTFIVGCTSFFKITLIQLAAMCAGFAIFGETAELECSRRLVTKLRAQKKRE